ALRVSDCQLPIAELISDFMNWQLAVGSRQSPSVSESFEDLIGVILRLDLLENLFDLSLLIDQKGGPMNTHVGSAHELLLSPNSVSFCDRPIRIGQKSEGKFVLGFKLFMSCFFVGRNTQDRDSFLLELGKLVSKGARLFGAARRVVFRIKIKHNLLPAKVF